MNNQQQQNFYGNQQQQQFTEQWMQWQQWQYQQASYQQPFLILDELSDKIKGQRNWKCKTIGRKKKEREKYFFDDSKGHGIKKCRARYGIDQQKQWCRSCCQKKKCVRYGKRDGSYDIMSDASSIDYIEEESLIAMDYEKDFIISIAC